MKTRHVTTPTGEAFDVPQGIQRLDSHSTRGWQVRYHGTKYYPDGQVGADKALVAATKDLLRRIATMPAPVSLRKAPSATKSSSLPVGISGPIVVRAAGSDAQSAFLSVLMPRFGRPNEVKNIYIGSQSTYTKTRYRAAVAEAIEIRAESVAQYEEEATRAKRKAANQLKKSLAAAR